MDTECVTTILAHPHSDYTKERARCKFYCFASRLLLNEAAVPVALVDLGPSCMNMHMHVRVRAYHTHMVWNMDLCPIPPGGIRHVNSCVCRATAGL